MKAKYLAASASPKESESVAALRRYANEHPEALYADAHVDGGVVTDAEVLDVVTHDGECTPECDIAPAERDAAHKAANLAGRAMKIVVGESADAVREAAAKEMDVIIPALDAAMRPPTMEQAVGMAMEVASMLAAPVARVGKHANGAQRSYDWAQRQKRRKQMSKASRKANRRR